MFWFAGEMCIAVLPLACKNGNELSRRPVCRRGHENRQPNNEAFRTTIGSHFITYEFTNANPTEPSTSGDAQP